MTDRERQLSARRAELLACSETMRADIGARSQELINGLPGARATATRPVLIAGAAELVLWFGPRGRCTFQRRALVILGLIKRLLTPSGYAKP